MLSASWIDFSGCVMADHNTDSAILKFRLRVFPIERYEHPTWDMITRVDHKGLRLVRDANTILSQPRPDAYLILRNITPQENTLTHYVSSLDIFGVLIVWYPVVLGLPRSLHTAADVQALRPQCIILVEKLFYHSCAFFALTLQSQKKSVKRACRSDARPPEQLKTKFSHGCKVIQYYDLASLIRCLDETKIFSRKNFGELNRHFTTSSRRLEASSCCRPILSAHLYWYQPEAASQIISIDI